MNQIDRRFGVPPDVFIALLNDSVGDFRYGGAHKTSSQKRRQLGLLLGKGHAAKWAGPMSVRLNASTGLAQRVAKQIIDVPSQHPIADE